jgi:RNA recognition motif-containing protein
MTGVFEMAEDSRKLFVAGLPDSVTEEILRQLFEATGGSVVEVSLPKDRQTGRPRGFGFVTMATVEEAKSARESLDGSFQGGKSISVRPFEADPPRREGGVGPRSSGDRGGPGGGAASAPDRTLYVGNLPYDASVEEVETLIGATGAGPVVRVHLPMDPEGRKRGFGFVTMASAEAAKAAIDGLRGADVRGRRLVVNLAHPKGERPAGSERTGGYAGGGGGGGGYVGGGGGGFGGFAGGGGGGPPGGGAPPPPPRKTFDDRRRRGPSDDGPPGGAGRGAGPSGASRGGGGGRNWDKNRKDWDADD